LDSQPIHQRELKIVNAMSAACFIRPHHTSMSLTWYPPNQSVQFQDLKLKGGMFYFTPKYLDWPGEPSAIISFASVRGQADSPSNDLGYYPSYQDLSPSQRRAYLEWLANGRRDPHPEQRALGYLFLFFYGIERRIILEKDRDPALIEELLALLQHYQPHHKSRSLRGYFLSLAHYGSLLKGAKQYRHYWPRLFELDEGKTGEEAMKLVLANLFELGEPMHWSIGYRLAMVSPSSRRSVVVSRAKQEFWTLFQSRFENDFPSGMSLKAAKQAAVFRYQPASPALLARTDYGKASPYEMKVANVAGLHTQFNRVSEIWNSCVDDLSGYTRAVSSKKQTDAAALKAWMALPEELKASKPSPMQPFWDWMTSKAPREDEFHFVTAGSLAPWFGIAERKKLTRAQANEIVYGTAAMGWTIAPHPDHVDQPFAWDQETVVYKRTTSDPPEPQIPGLVRLLYLLMPVAAADGTVEQSEIDSFRKLVGHEVTKDSDWQYLEAVLAALMRDSNVAIQALPAMTKHIPARTRDAVFNLLVHIAAADGEVAPEEIKVLRKIARALELDANTAERILREDVAFREVTVAEAKPAKRTGEKIPDQEVSRPTGLHLDMDRIAALTKETHEVVSMLSAVMIEDSPPELETPATRSSAASDAVPDWVSSIAPRYQIALVYLVQHDELDAESFDSLAATHHLMADDLFNSINAWADEKLGDFLLERSDPIRIYRDLVSSNLPN
jgi:uncharacterized tellurite resistance protein B-like protein